MLLAAAAQLGEVDAFAWVDSRRGDLARVGPSGPDRLWISDRPPVADDLARRAAWLAGGRLPLRVALRDNSEARASFAAFRRHRYDAAIVVGAEAAAVFGDLIPEPVILDLIDLEDTKVRSRLDVPARAAPGGRSRAGALLALTQARRDERAWRRLQLDLARRVALVSVCSELDRQRLGWPAAAVVPNGYELPAVPAGDRPRNPGASPTITFVGSFTYPPNVDAARYLVHEVAPVLGRLVPGVQIRLVGRASAAVAALADPPRVVVTGFVDSVEEELARADVVAVPVRQGGGTRIKVLEAFAHRIPVVSTRLGAEGIEAVDGCHLRLADGPRQFASACAELIGRSPARESLVDAAHLLFREHYQWPEISRQAATLIQQVSARDRVAR